MNLLIPMKSNAQLILLALLFLSIREISAFDSHYNGTALQIGIAYSKLDILEIENFNDYEGRIGFICGFNAEFFPTSFSVIQFGVEYCQKGYKSTTSDNAEKSTRLDYLSIPALLKVGIFKNIWIPSLIFGPRLDILISATQNDINEDIIDDLNILTMGMRIGVCEHLATLKRIEISLLSGINIDFQKSNINFLRGPEGGPYQEINWTSKNISFDLLKVILLFTNKSNAG